MSDANEAIKIIEDMIKKAKAEIKYAKTLLSVQGYSVLMFKSTNLFIRLNDCGEIIIGLGGTGSLRGATFLTKNKLSSIPNINRIRNGSGDRPVVVTTAEAAAMSIKSYEETILMLRKNLKEVKKYMGGAK